jgi:hypothetical protein
MRSFKERCPGSSGRISLAGLYDATTELDGP